MAFLARTWFPLALIALFVLALPGVVLCVLTLVGADAQVNDWLQENFQLSYHLDLAPWLTLVLLLLPLFIVLLYFLKLKRKPLQVPSTFLWKKSVEDLHVNSLFQWLRENVLLVLQILAILILIYSVLGLRFHGNTGSSQHYILIVDNSASMSATDVEPSRLDWAKQEALKEIDAASEDDYGMVIVFNSKATTLQTYTNNKGKLREAVRNIALTQRVTRIEEALALAESLANPVRSTEDVASQPDKVPEGQERTMVQAKGIDTAVHLYSDGRFAKLTEANLAALSAKQTGNKLLGNLNLKYHRAGVPGPDKVNNVGIVSLSAVRLVGKSAKGANLDVHKLKVLVDVRNYRPDPASVKLQLDVYAGGKIVQVGQQTLLLEKRALKKDRPETEEDEDRYEPGAAAEPIEFQLPALDLRGNIVLHAYLEGANDAFPLDDQAWLAVGTLRKAKVLIVGPDNPVLDAFFDQEATRRLAAVDRLEAKELATDQYRKKASSGEVDLVIFDRCAPQEEADLPQASAWFIDRVPPPWRRAKNTLKNPTVFASNAKHPLLRNLTTLYDLGVTEAFILDLKSDLDDKVRPLFELPDGDPRRRTLPPLTRLLEANRNVPVLFTLPRGAYTDLVMTFALVGDGGDLPTNWPLQPSFPLFLRNVLYVLGNVDDAVRPVSVQPGEPMVLRPEAGVQSLEVTPPLGAMVKLQRGSRPDFVFAATDQVGVYQVKRDDGGVRSFAVNLLDANESNIEPRKEIRIGTERYATGQDRAQPRELWKWILLLAVVLLMAEWYIYNRRVSL